MGSADGGAPIHAVRIPTEWPFIPSAIPRMVEGHLLSDVIAINASIDIVMGEIDR